MNQTGVNGAGERTLREVHALVVQAEAELAGQLDDAAAWALGDLVPLQGEICLLLPSDTIYPAAPVKTGADPVRLLDQAVEVMVSRSLSHYPAGAHVVLGRIIDAARNMARYRGDTYPLDVSHA
ncbi:hypothetical protein [Ornithinimicrobium panacihumi]|uniref:hypothetical protein n=1 Tax=Ornithinimicrobium panacihumi TaxID=2008449 RepID=UPI003F898697